jgi:hypothetical protein
VGRLEERIRKLEAQAEAEQLTEEARWQRVQEKVLNRLSVEDVEALLETVDAAIEHSADSGMPVDLRDFADERGLRAIARYEKALEAVRREAAL